MENACKGEYLTDKSLEKAWVNMGKPIATVLRHRTDFNILVCSVLMFTIQERYWKTEKSSESWLGDDESNMLHCMKFVLIKTLIKS